MRGPRHFACWLTLTSVTLCASGCAMLGETEDPAITPHTPAVEVSLPTDKSKPSSAPLWKPAGSKGETAATKTSTTLPPGDELKQILGNLLATGKIDQPTYDESIKNVARTDPTTIDHLLWMYRAVAKGSLTNEVAKSAEKPKAQKSTLAAIEEKSEDHLTKTLVAANEMSLEKKVEPTSKPQVKDEPTQVVQIEKQDDPKVIEIPSKPTSNDWQQELEQAIVALEGIANDGPIDQQKRNAAQLRMLYLTAGRKNDALKPLPGLNEAEQDFWSKELYGLATYLDHERIGDPARRAAEATRHLQQAAARLGETSQLVVRNLAFCSEVVSYGVYTGFAKSEFKPGQQVLLYAEIENFRSEETPKGFHTAMKSHYQIFDTQGRKVDEHDFAIAEERCQNPRRDYFVRYFVNLPTRIYDGRYTLQLTVEDTLGKKVGQSTIEFNVKTK